ncbi:MAG: S-methyl-5-thioribose-1-phosphate isomerase [Chloroflexi bacterium]|nr:S-methyl-5-thioribose-1-phosphate isomerase [Chloroflexota bacterium]
MRTVELHNGALRLIDQTALPADVRVVECRTVDEVADAIRSMKVRGAPAIGAAAAFGLAIGAHAYTGDDPAGLLAHLEDAAARLMATRPTAVNLAWAVGRVLECARQQPGGVQRGADRAAVERAQSAVTALAQDIADEDVEVNRQIGAHGAALVPNAAAILTHCNTGALATVDYGTALGIVRAAAEAGKRIHVYVDETRPFLQGARLTAWELQQAGIPQTLISDNMAGHFIGRGAVDLVVVGADRIAANGDVANKIGTYTLAVLCKENGVPFYVAAPTSTVDLSIASGDAIPIEERSSDEVTHIRGIQIAPDGVAAAHPAFDVTPARYVTAIVTEQGVHRAPYGVALRQAVEAAAAHRRRREEEQGRVRG